MHSTIHIQRAGIISILIVITFFFTGKLFSQDSQEWSLEQCINYALENNIDIKKQILNIDYQEKLLLQSKLGILPNFNGYASFGYNLGQNVDRYTNQFAGGDNRVASNNLALQGDLNLFNGLQQLKTIQRNLLNLQAAQSDADYYRDEISILVATEYLQTLYYLEFVAIAKNQLEITNQTVDRTGKLVDAGTLAKGDLLIIEAQQASEELSLVNAENNLALSYLNLTQLLELPTPQGFEIETPELGLIDQPDIFTPEQIYTIAIDNRPEIKSAETRMESSAKDLGIARGTYYPSLSLNYSVGSGYSGANYDFDYDNPTVSGESVSGYWYTDDPDNPLKEVYTPNLSYPSELKKYGTQLDENFNQSVFLNLRVPIFNGWASRTSVAQAKIGIEDAKLSLQSAKRDLYKIIQQAYNDAIAASNKHKAANKKVNATSEAFKYAEQKFEVGLINSVEYNDSKKEYNNALAELTQAKYDFVFRMTVIDFYMGKPLTLNR